VKDKALDMAVWGEKQTNSRGSGCRLKQLVDWPVRQHGLRSHGVPQVRFSKPSCEDGAEWGYEEYLDRNQASLFSNGVAA